MLDDGEFIQAVRAQLRIVFCEGNENNAKHTLTSLRQTKRPTRSQKKADIPMKAESFKNELK